MVEASSGTPEMVRRGAEDGVGERGHVDANPAEAAAASFAQLPIAPSSRIAIPALCPSAAALYNSP